jgi:hypothetical protein
MSHVRVAVIGAAAAALICLGAAPSAGAAPPVRLVLDQGAAFSLLGHSCGGIQEQVYATGFGPAPGGYPEGDVYMSTRCGGSGRGGGYKVTTYSGTAVVVWNWFGQTRSYARLEGPAGGGPEFSAEDAHGDRIYNVGTSAYLETGEPPLQPPGAPTALQASLSSIETAEEEPPTLRFTVEWTPDPANAGLISSSTVTATPTGGSSAPVLTATVSGSGTSAVLQPLARRTTYLITVRSTDAEGASAASEALEANSVTGTGGPPPPPPPVPLASCETNQGTIKLSPGISETPHVQAITIKGQLSGCGGGGGLESASYVDHLQTTEEVTCSILQSLSSEPTTAPVSLSVKWSPKELGRSRGTLVVPITEAGSVTVTGTLEGGPFGGPEPITGGEVWESFAGGPSCGVAEGKKKARPVKNASFSGTPLEIGEVPAGE